jgi:phosphoribosylaminoimidazolecarboxamide formyltransferase / IMP cyclohydrolase
VAIKRALVSVYDKTGVAEFARALAAAGAEIVSTGGTARLLRENGVTVRDVAEMTGWPEMLGGRVKTLHPKVHGGILFRRDNEYDIAETLAHGIFPVDAVVVNLYPFEATAARPNVAVDELIENIDIGGPAMVRSAAKNFSSVAVITDPADYGALAAELCADAERAGWSLATRLRLAQKAFAATARYDDAIATELKRLAASGDEVTFGEAAEVSSELPERLRIDLRRAAVLRYGENPHQHAALYIFSAGPAGGGARGLAGARQLQGKELSYNNLVDLDAAWDLAQEFTGPAAVIVKHNNPCGTAEQPTLAAAYRQALACDPVAAFGGVLAFNRPLDGETAAEVGKLFVECVVAPGYSAEAREALGGKKNLRLMEIGDEAGGSTRADAVPAEMSFQLKRISGGVLVQGPDEHVLDRSELKVVTKRPPTSAEVESLLFAWKVAKHVKSNAIVFAREGRTVGIGAGQMSRVDAVKIAVMKAVESLAGSVVASDAFFPFPDGVEEAARAGATAVIQPGGSVRDAEVIAAADSAGMAMVFTGVRHFRH